MNGLGKRKRHQICHCAPVRRLVRQSVLLWHGTGGRGFLRRCAHRLGMTGAVRVVAVYVSVVRPCGSMWASTPTKRYAAGIDPYEMFAALRRNGGVRSPRPTLYRSVLPTCHILLFRCLQKGGQSRPPLRNRREFSYTQKGRGRTPPLRTSIASSASGGQSRPPLRRNAAITPPLIPPNTFRPIWPAR